MKKPACKGLSCEYELNVGKNELPPLLTVTIFIGHEGDEAADNFEMPILTGVQLNAEETEGLASWHRLGIEPFVLENNTDTAQDQLTTHVTNICEDCEGLDWDLDAAYIASHLPGIWEFGS